jgi:hypothetical protein
MDEFFTLDDFRFPVESTNLAGHTLDDLAFPIAVDAEPGVEGEPWLAVDGGSTWAAVDGGTIWKATSR